MTSTTTTTPWCDLCTCDGIGWVRTATETALEHHKRIYHPGGIRRYETFTIRWDDGGSCSGYDTADEAQATVNRSTRPGRVVRRVFEVAVKPEHAHLYRPGI